MHTVRKLLLAILVMHLTGLAFAQTPQLVLPVIQSQVTFATLSPDGRYLASSSEEIGRASCRERV